MMLLWFQNEKAPLAPMVFIKKSALWGLKSVTYLHITGLSVWRLRRADMNVLAAEHMPELK